MKVVIVGGVAGGASAAARLRRLDEKAEIILLERGEDISFANCGLPYFVGGIIKEEKKLHVQTAASFHARFMVDVRVQHNVLAIDPAAKTLRIQNRATGEEYTETYDKLLLSPGAEPMRPPLSGVEDKRIFTLRTIPDTLAIRNFLLKNKPKSVAVIGGGFIGLEMAENFAHMGLQVTIVEMAHHILPPFDREMGSILKNYLVEKGIRLYLGQAVQGFAPHADGITVETEEQSFPVDMVLLSIGVRPESSLASAAGLAVGKRGGIVVDANLKTSNPHIYAVGDAVEVTQFVSGEKQQIPLAGPANKQGRIAADNINGIPTRYNGTQGSAILKLFDMTAATTGLNETAIRAAGLAFDKVYINAGSHASYYPGAQSMIIKLLFEQKTGRILGAQLVGFGGVNKRCDVLATAIRARMTVLDLAELELCYAPPYSTAKDPVNLAGYAAENILQGKVKQYYWEDLSQLPTDGSVTLLDVRTPAEFERGSVEHAKSIPLDTLRERLSELDLHKKIYVTCQSGLRSYVACRILMQNGFDAYNFAGGYGLYQILTKS